jgi:hypothetical protein
LIAVSVFLASGLILSCYAILRSRKKTRLAPIESVDESNTKTMESILDSLREHKMKGDAVAFLNTILQFIKRWPMPDDPSLSESKISSRIEMIKFGAEKVIPEELDIIYRKIEKDIRRKLKVKSVEE